MEDKVVHTAQCFYFIHYIRVINIASQQITAASPHSLIPLQHIV